MTITQNRGSQLFISNEPLPENPTADDFNVLEWVEVCGTVEPPVIEFTYTAQKARVIILRGTYSYAIGQINKPKRQRFGRVVKFR